MQPLTSHTPARSALNQHPLRAGFVGAILGGLGSGLVVGVPLFILAMLLSAHHSEGFSSAHGMSIGEVALLLLLGSIFLAPLCALAGVVGGALAGMTRKPTLVNIAWGAVGGGILIGLLCALWLGNSESGTFDAAGEVIAFCLGGIPGAIGGGIGAAIGAAVRSKLGAD